MFRYWKMIFDLQILILMFIRLEREQDFALYVQVLKPIVKYIFAFSHYNYARWLTIHVDDLMKLELVCPNVYKEFCSGNFVVQKTINPFSAIALDQTSNENKGKHHEDYTEFQKTFFNDTQKLFFCFNEIRNPFEENRLVVLDTGD